jgi:hypothetical protein
VASARPLVLSTVLLFLGDNPGLKTVRTVCILILVNTENHAHRGTPGRKRPIVSSMEKMNTEREFLHTGNAVFFTMAVWVYTPLLSLFHRF